MVSIYDVLKASKGIHVEDSFAEIWGRKLRGGYEIKTLTGVPPLEFNSAGEPLIDWVIHGNVTQNDSPTPYDPDYPVGVGEKTGNLICASQTGSSTSSGLTLTYTQGSSAVTLDKDTTSGAVFGTVPTSITLAAGTYAVSVQNLLVKVANTYDRIYIVDSNNTVVVNYVMSNAPKSFTLAAETTISKISFVCDASSVYDSATITIMLNTGSTSKPFEPYGYKIPVTCNGVTTNIYLSSVISTRRIKKLVLTGEEDWLLHTSYANLFRLNTITDYLFALQNITICNAYEGIINGGAANVGDKQTGFYYTSGASIRTLYIKDTNYSTAADFKAFLAQQYANGTPVTIWYVLAEPETAATNEPLMKIGSYADELTKTGTSVNIPTTNGSNTLTVGTTVQPSSMSITFRGK